jgi:hypothetical protein
MNKHVLKEGTKEYWISDSGLKREIPVIEERKHLTILKIQIIGESKLRITI